MQHEMLSSIAGLTVSFVSAGNAAGQGTLRAVTADTIAWTAPGSETEGAAISIANDETQIVPDGDDATAYLVVARTSASDLSGSAALLIIAALTNSERLAEVDAAISECLKAQAAGSGGDSVTLASLDALRRYRQQVYAAYLREQNTSARHGRADMRGNF